MRLTKFNFVEKSENRARLFFVKRCWKNYRRFCIRCRSYQIYGLQGKRYRCKRCGYTFHDLSGRWINKLRISYRKWMWILKLFELEISARRISQQVELSYPTTLKAVNVIRMAILAHAEDGQELLGGEIEADEAYFGGRRKGNRGRSPKHKIPVFGILERNGLVKVHAVKNVTAETLLGLTLKTVRRGSIVYTDRYSGYDTLMFCGYRHLRVDNKQYFSAGKVYINGLEGFWSYAKERLIKHHGVSREKFPLYLKEMEFRYNHRTEDIFDIMVQYLCDLVPDL